MRRWGTHWFLNSLLHVRDVVNYSLFGNSDYMATTRSGNQYHIQQNIQKISVDATKREKGQNDKNRTIGATGMISCPLIIVVSSS